MKKVFISFLMPYPIRSIEAPYLWVYYKQMSSFKKDEIIFIGSKEYRGEPHIFDAKRFEIKSTNAEYLGYSVPAMQEIESYQFYDFDNAIFRKLEQMHNYNTNQIFKKLLTEPMEEVEKHLNELFTSITKNNEVEAILSWCNFPSLSRVASKFNLRIIHNELGAFRKPYYQPTAYLDFSGVNGNTESQKRFEQFTDAINQNLILGLHEIRQTMFLGEISDLKEDRRFDIGVALQVEDDSNILAFSNGFDSISLVRWITDNYPNKSLSIREHPSGYLKYDKLGEIDASSNSIDFLLKCGMLITINSSVALEALLFEKQIKILGDSPFAFLTNVHESQKLIALNFAIFGYMIPYDYLFDYDYYRWRLGNPTESEIFHKHLNYYKTRRADLSEIKVESFISYNEHIQLFLDQGDGFSEENSLKLPVAPNNEPQTLIFDISGYETLTSIRLDPLNEACVVEIEELKLIRADGGALDLTSQMSTNACFTHGKSYFFETIDPIIHFDRLSKDKLADATKLSVTISYIHTARDAVEVCAKQTKAELDQIKASLSWRITKPLRKMKQILKGKQ